MLLNDRGRLLKLSLELAKENKAARLIEKVPHNLSNVKSLLAFDDDEIVCADDCAGSVPCRLYCGRKRRVGVLQQRK